MNARARALEHAQANLGVSEEPLGSNTGPAVTKWLHKAGAPAPNPWCAAFAFAMFRETGTPLAIPAPAAVLSWVEYSDAHGWTMARPFRADLVAYSWHGPTPHPDDHIGFVERVLALPWPRNGRRYYLRTIEGNERDAVRRVWRWVDPATVRFIRVPG